LKHFFRRYHLLSLAQELDVLLPSFPLLLLLRLPQDTTTSSSYRLSVYPSCSSTSSSRFPGKSLDLFPLLKFEASVRAPSSPFFLASFLSLLGLSPTLHQIGFGLLVTAATARVLYLLHVDNRCPPGSPARRGGIKLFERGVISFLVSFAIWNVDKSVSILLPSTFSQATLIISGRLVSPVTTI